MCFLSGLSEKDSGFKALVNMDLSPLLGAILHVLGDYAIFNIYQYFVINVLV